MNDAYPVQFEVQYPDRQLNRLTTGLRFLTIIPIAIVLGTVDGGAWSSVHGGATTRTFAIGAGGVLVGGPLLMILFRQKYPRWWFDWNLELTRFSVTRLDLRCAARRPLSVDRRTPVADARDCLPGCADRAESVATAGQMVAGDPPLHHPVLPRDRGVRMRGDRVVLDPDHRSLPAGPVRLRGRRRGWGVRVAAYAFLMATDRYPPFSLNM